MNHGSLFSGIGGFDYAAQLMGWTNRFHCEWNPFGQKVLKYYWPQAESYSDITKTDFSIWRDRIDILTGGFPCQPYSTAGKRLGKEDERHLWPEMLRAIREIQPRYVVGENVSGLVNWNGGMVFEEVQAELEAEGYEVRPFILPACAVNAPHRRDRIWFVAYSISARAGSFSRSTCDERGGTSEDRAASLRQTHWPAGTSRINSASSNGSTSDTSSDRRKWEREGIETQEGQQSRPKSTGIMEGRPEGFCSEWTTSYTDSQGREERMQASAGRQDREENRTGMDNRTERPSGEWDASDTDGLGLRGQSDGAGKSGFFGQNGSGDYWRDFPTQSPVCTRNDGISSRLDGITFPKWRNESIKAGGNAIVPQVALQIFKAIQEFEQISQ